VVDHVVLITCRWLNAVFLGQHWLDWSVFRAADVLTMVRLVSESEMLQFVVTTQCYGRCLSHWLKILSCSQCCVIVQGLFVFSQRSYWWSSNGVISIGCCVGGAGRTDDFWPLSHYISQMVQGMDIVTVES